jgi:tetratricopeptide (TPR) repeat protein
MYFENRTDEKDIDKILVDMLITNLGRNKQISVVSGQRLYDILKSLGKQDAAVVDRSTATEAAKQAGVKTMLLGSIWNVGGKLNVTGQLLDVESGAVINSDRLEASKAEEVFAVADRLTEKVGEWLRESPAAAFKIADATTDSYEAYRLYEQGMRHSYRFEHAEALECFRQAIRLDSTFAMAHFRLSRNLGWGALMSALPSKNLFLAREAIARAERHAGNLSDRDRGMIEGYATALRRDYDGAKKKWEALLLRFPEDKELLFASAVGSMIKGEQNEAIRSFEKAIEVDRSFSDAYNLLGYAYCTIGEYDKAIATIRTYIALIPDAENGYDSGCEVHMMAGRFDDAMKIAEEGLKHAPDWHASYDRQGQILLLKGEPDKAREKFTSRGKIEPGYRQTMDLRTSMSFAREGRMTEATILLHQLVERTRNAGEKLSELMARFYLARLLLEGDRLAEALKELEAVKELSREVRTDPANPWPLVCDY